VKTNHAKATSRVFRLTVRRHIIIRYVAKPKNRWKDAHVRWPTELDAARLFDTLARRTSIILALIMATVPDRGQSAVATVPIPGRP
jgi:hypothetical protein